MRPHARDFSACFGSPAHSCSTQGKEEEEDEEQEEQKEEEEGRKGAMNPNAAAPLNISFACAESGMISSESQSGGRMGEQKKEKKKRVGNERGVLSDHKGFLDRVGFFCLHLQQK